MKWNGMNVSITRTVTTVEHLSTGYVRVDAGGRQYAQLPKEEWDALDDGETVPEQYSFEPGWCRMRKPVKDENTHTTDEKQHIKKGTDDDD